jgi:hypothetical protein
VVQQPALTPQEYVDTLISVAYPHLGDFIDSHAQDSLLIPDGLIAIGGTTDLYNITGPPFADPVLINHLYHQSALVSRL